MASKGLQGFLGGLLGGSRSKEIASSSEEGQARSGISKNGRAQHHAETLSPSKSSSLASIPVAMPAALPASALALQGLASGNTISIPLDGYCVSVELLPGGTDAQALALEASQLGSAFSLLSTLNGPVGSTQLQVHSAQWLSAGAARQHPTNENGRLLDAPGQT